MKTSIKITLIIVLVFSTIVVKAQDPHFSQYYASPLLLNPALTAMHDGEFRVAANQKSQWKSISTPYTTSAVTFDLPVGRLGLGFLAINQHAGEVSYNNLNLLGSASYIVSFGKYGYGGLSFGLQAGIIHRSLNLNDAIFDDQFDGVGGVDPSGPSNDAVQMGSKTLPDANAGFLVFDGNPFARANVFAGGAIYHLIETDESFTNSSGFNLPKRIVAHAGVRLKVNKGLEITPMALFMTQRKAQEIALGLTTQFNLNAPGTSFLLGGNYRIDDASIIHAGLIIKDLAIGLSYDFNTSTLTPATNSRGGLEVSLTYTRKRTIDNPKFICPRL